MPSPAPAFFPQKLRTAIDTRATDQTLRLDTPGIAIVDVRQLMDDLAHFGPHHYRTKAERRAYLEAVRDIAIHVQAATYTHHESDGHLVRIHGLIRGVHTNNVTHI
ncbi:hypothetical protein [Propionicimonas sp.]|uniref:hypothetical protein n=1 Tax=Propionicimonas sp. TaxID=1955623 RepID=UPI001800837E|nr:hypothetical protein [Propionicimonas sp.]MBA3019637.1 hypothetical protein [Propionicimonas sp.]MBU4208018.1 hypothetical protein [Actinomycetota bacterium]MCG2805756.1 hypothetical protein [Propionicimonas sp.]